MSARICLRLTREEILMDCVFSLSLQRGHATHEFRMTKSATRFDELADSNH
jgi:hypothetical protein